MEDKILSIIKAYYWATPLFLLLDLLLGIDVRVSAFVYHPVYKGIYYVFCFVCMAIVVWKPSASALVGLIESSINTAILCVGMMLSVYLMGDLAIEEMESFSPVTGERVINFILAGSICVSSFYRNVSAVSHRSRRNRSPWNEEEGERKGRHRTHRKKMG